MGGNFNRRRPRQEGTGPDEHGIYLIRPLEQLAVLESPVRLEILDVVAAGGRSSIAEVAAQMGRTPESLYFHFKKLVAAGLLAPAGTRKRARHREWLYRTPGRRMTLGLEPMTGRRREALIKIIGAALRDNQREVASGMRSPDAVMHGAERNVYVTRQKGWLTPAQRRRVDALIEEIERLMAESRLVPGAELMSVCLTVTRCQIRHSARTRDVPGPE